jgi:hypothetical protein
VKPRELHLPTHWRLRGSAAQAFEILSAPLEFVRWWPEVYLAVREVRPGDANGVGRLLDLETKGKLPYRLRWQAEVLAVDKPRAMSIRAQGDLDGRGEWRFAEDGDFVDVRYDWTVYVAKPWMVVLAPALRPVFAANHHWAMARGLEGLTRELARSNAARST